MEAEVGVRELRQNASKLLRRVAEGESITVTDRGRPVARLVPIARTNGLAELIATGQVTLAQGEWRSGPLLKLEPGQPTLSEVLAEMREEER